MEILIGLQQGFPKVHSWNTPKLSGSINFTIRGNVRICKQLSAANVNKINSAETLGI